MSSVATQAREARNGIHPTKEELIKTVVVLLDSLTLDEITSEKVLEISGISRGSLYHHFQDFAELLEIAQVRRFSRYVDASIAVLTELFSSVNTRDELVENLTEVSKTFQAPTLADSRIERLTVISNVMHNPRMANVLGEEQERLTETIADLYRDLQKCGLANPDLHPRTAAVMFQAYTLGRSVDDFTVNHMDQDNWLYAVKLVVENIFFPAVNWAG
jgi:AcrR family transcriptional regulator